MKNYLRYKAVVYWTNLLKKRESYCINPAFFATAHVFLTHETLVAKLRAEIPADSLRWLQETAQPPYRNRLEIDGKHWHPIHAKRTWMTPHKASLSVETGNYLKAI